MSDPVTSDPRRRLAAEAVYDAILQAKRDAGDAAVCDGLDMVAACAGQNRLYRYAAAAIRGLPPGRPAIDDDLALRRILKFPPERRREAVGIVAQDMARGAGASSKEVKAIVRRLHRKLAINEMDEIVSSTSLPS
jgi:hypothetical protein